MEHEERPPERGFGHDDLCRSAFHTGVGGAFAGGLLHSCAITNTGVVKCWGRNNAAQLGNDATVDSSVPVDVLNLGAGTVVTAAAAGTSHTCALTSVGGVKCWGVNTYGGLGDGTGTNQQKPVDVSGLTIGVVAVAAGGDGTCAVTAAGAMKCWGHNNGGQLGDGSTTARFTPVDVSGLSSGATSIAVGRDHTCAVTTGGALSCWGYNTAGKLGDGTIDAHSIPAPVSDLSSGVAGVAAGAYHTCAVLTDGTAKCWGRNDYGQVGIWGGRRSALAHRRLDHDERRHRDRCLPPAHLCRDDRWQRRVLGPERSRPDRVRQRRRRRHPAARSSARLGRRVVDRRELTHLCGIHRPQGAVLGREREPPARQQLGL